MHAVQPSTQTSVQAYHQETKGTSSLLGRVIPGWDKTILFCNVALIVAGVAHLFFIKLPLLAIGLATYGIIYLSLFDKTRVIVQGNKDTDLEKNIETKNQLLAENKELEQSIQRREAKKARLEREINALTARKKSG